MKKKMLSTYSAIILCGAVCLSYSLPSRAQAPTWMWADAPQGATSNDIYSVVTDASGNSYVAGSFFGTTIAFGNITLSGAGTQDIFIVKYDPSGNVLWAKSAGGSDYENVYGISLDGMGDIYITGYFMSSVISFDNITLTSAGAKEVYLTKYDASGNVLWAKSAGGPGFDESYDVKTDASGNAFITGYFSNGNINFGNTTLINQNASSDIFIAKYDPAGNLVWAKREGTTGFETGQCIATDASGNFYLTGTFADSITFGATTLSGTGGRDVFVIKYDTSGTALWARSAVGSDFDISSGIAAYPDGHTYITGFFSSPFIIFGNDTLLNAGGSDIFIVEYDSSGNVEKAIRAGGTGSEVSSAIAITGPGTSCITGQFDSPQFTLGNTTLTNTGIANLFVAKESNGNFDWALSPNGYYNMARDVAVDASGSIFVTGWFSGQSFTLGNFTMLNSGNTSCFTGKLDAQASAGEEYYISNSLTVFPNPGNGNLNVQSDQVIDEIQIRNLIGQLVYNSTPGLKKVSLSLENNGVYFLTIREGKQTQTKKIVVQR